MLSVVLLDTIEDDLTALENILKVNSSVKIVGKYKDPIIALKEIKSLKPDVVFLEINIPLQNGINVAKKIIAFDYNIHIVFITTSVTHAVTAFEINALDYILKPVNSTRINKTLDKLYDIKIMKINHKSNVINGVKTIEKYLKINSEKIVALSDNGVNVIKISEILFLNVKLKDVYIETKVGNFKTKGPLDFWELKLKDYGFFRCHRNFLINLKYTVNLSHKFNNNYIVKQEASNFEIPISTRNFKQFKKILGLK